jgi:hypothetical protein
MHKNMKGVDPSPPKFSPEGGFSHGIPIAYCLKGLTFAEEALISRIQPVMAACMW